MEYLRNGSIGECKSPQAFDFGQEPRKIGMCVFMVMITYSLKRCFSEHDL